MRLLCARDEEVARLLCRHVVEFTAEFPLTDRAVEFLAWREHGRRWTESLMAGVIAIRGPEAAVRGNAGGVVPGPCEGQAFCGGHGQLGKLCMPARTIRSPRSCSCRCKIDGGQCTRSCEVIHPSARQQGGSNSVRRGMRSTASPATCRRPFRGHRCMRCWCQGRTSRTRRPRPCSLTRWRRWRRL